MPKRKKQLRKPKEDKKSHRLHIMARVLGIPAYEELANLRMQSRKGIKPLLTGPHGIKPRSVESLQLKRGIRQKRMENQLQKIQLPFFLERQCNGLRHVQDLPRKKHMLRRFTYIHLAEVFCSDLEERKKILSLFQRRAELRHCIELTQNRQKVPRKHLIEIILDELHWLHQLSLIIRAHESKKPGFEEMIRSLEKNRTQFKAALSDITHETRDEIPIKLYDFMFYDNLLILREQLGGEKAELLLGAEKIMEEFLETKV